MSVNLDDQSQIEKIDKELEQKVKVIVDKLKISHNKFVDPDFGPNENDEFGAISLYGSSMPAPSGSKYPPPDTLKWERPVYDDQNFLHQNEVKQAKDTDEEDQNEDENDDFDDEFAPGGHSDDSDDVWCKHGKLFLDGVSSGDVVQGQLGDCWFLSALAVMGTQDELLKACFWRLDTFQEFGIYVCRFFKDCSLMFVVIDDRIPVKVKDGKVIFGQCKDPNELWVPLIEKAYAKLHGCYKALIGGYSHFALGDMTGFPPHAIILKKGFLGYCEDYSDEEVKAMLRKYRDWNCLMGCSIQPDPKGTHKVEEEAGLGLHSGHAYSLLDLNEIILPDTNEKILLLKLRNPWGRGEWEGPFGDRSEEREKYDDIIMKVFKDEAKPGEVIEQNFNDGTFFIPFDEWRTRFTSLFVAVNFPKSWTGKRSQGVWTGEVGGNREMGTWISNPKLKLRLSGENVEYKQVFVGLYIKDSRLTMGFDYYKDPLYSTPLAFDIVTEEDFNKAAAERALIKGKKADGDHPAEQPAKQPAYNFGTTQIEVFLKCGVDYFIVPSLYKRKQPGSYFLTVYAESDFELEGGIRMTTEQQAMVLGPKDKRTDVAESPTKLKTIKSLNENISSTKSKKLTMSVAQFYEKKEQLRSKIISEMNRLHLNLNSMASMFESGANSERLTPAVFKRRMMNLGFSLADFPDEDLVVLDEDNSGYIESNEFTAFVDAGLKFSDPVSLPAPPAQPVDDLLYKPTDLEGVLTVKIPAARQLREPATWFSERITKMDDDKSTTSNSSAPADPAAAGVENANRSDTDMKSEIKTRRLIKYDAKAAMEWHERNKKEALEALKSGTKSFSRSNALGMIPETEEGEDKTKVSTKKASAKPTDDIRTSMEADLARQVPGSPSSQNGIDDARTVHSVDINSVSRKELTLRAGVEAGQKLRRDPSLQKAETNRTVLLGALKSSRHKAASQERAAKIDAESALRKKVKLGKEVKKRDIMKDPAAMALLNIPHPTIADDVKQGDVIGKEALPVRKPISSNVNATTEKPTDMTTTDRSAPANATQASAIPSDAKMIKSPDDQMTRAVWGPDLWEVIVDAVITISDSRLRRRDKTENEDKSADLSLFWRLAGQGHRVSGDAFAMFDPPKSPLATPTPSSKAKPTKIVKGSIPTPKNLRKSASGYASVSTTMSVLKHRSNVSDAKQKLQDVAEDQNNAYDEIYRRLILVPAMTYAELNGDKKASNSQQHHFNYALRFFRRADKNKNNLISFPEFVTFLKEHNIDITMEDSKSLFERFQTNKRDGNIDWEEFVNFFNNITTSSRDQMIPDKRPLQMIISLLKKTLVEVLKEMKERSVASLDMLISYRTASVQGVMVPKTPKITRPSLSHKLSEPSVSMNKSGYNDLISNDDDEDDIDNNAIFHQLEANDASTNATRLRKLGLDITDDEMLRISRVFGYNVNYLMSFIRKPIIKCNGEPGRANMTQVTVNDAVNETISMLTTIFEQKSGVSERDLTTHENILKVWYGIAPTIGTTVSYDDVASYFYNTLTDNLVAKKEKNSLVNSMDVEIPSQNSSGLIRAALSSPDKTTGSVRNGSYDNLKPAIKIFNIDARILSRIMVDNMVYSIWNRSNTNNVPQAGFIPNDRTLISTLSLSGFEAYIRETFIDKLERKLRYLMEIEKNSSSPSVYLLVHVFLKSSLDEFIILAHDPITGEIYKINSKEDLRDLPINEKLYRLFPYRDRIEEFSNQLPTDVRMKCYNPYAYHYYNPWDTPYEDAAISGVITRLRLIRGENTKSKLIISEEEKFVQQIKTILDNSVELPFFCSVNETVLRFDVEAAVITDQSICRYIFGNIRKQKPLYSFLVRVMSSLNVVLSSYNSGVLVVMTWGSMLAYLTGYRNPFVTIQLLPRFLEPEHYHYYLKDDNSVFTGDNEENDPYTVHKADVCVDGGTHPVWNTEFKINFQPPKLTSCKVLSTGITKMKIESSFKYVVVLVREGILPSTSPTNPAIIFKFLTAYDPRAATEYQCGVHDDCKLSDLLKRRDVVTKKDDATAEADQINELEELVQALENAADTNKLILGPAITPRLLLSVYNKRGNGEELIGSAQMSISSVLSGSGVGKAQWVTLTYSFDSGNGKMVDSKAGEVQVELSFRKKAEIIAEIQAETDRVKRLQQQYESRKTTSRKFQLDSLDEVNHMKSIQSTARQTTMEAMVVSLSESTDDQKTQDSIVQEKFQPSNNSSNERNKLTPEIELKLKNAINEGKKLLQEKNEIDSHNKTLLAKLQEQDDIIQKLHHEKHALINTTETPDKNNDDPKNDQYSTYSHEEISKRDELIQTKELQLQRLQKEHDLLRQESEELRQQFNRNINDLTTQSIKSNDFHDSSINIFTIEKSSDITTELLRHFLLRQQKITGGKMTSAGGGPLEPLNRMLKTYGRSSDDKISKTDFKDALNHLMIQMSMEQIQLLYDEVHCEPMTVTALITYLKQQMNSFMIQKNSSRKVATDTNNSNTTTIPFTGTSSSGGGIMSDTVSDNSKKKKKVKPSTMKNIDENIKDFSVDERPTVSAIKAQTSEIYLPQIASAKPRPLSSTSVIGTNDKKIMKESTDRPKSGSAVSQQSGSESDFDLKAPSLQPLQPKKTSTKKPSNSTTTTITAATTTRSEEGAAINWDMVELPKGWAKQKQADTNRTFYIDHVNKRTQWHHPLDPNPTKVKRRSQDNPTEVSAAAEPTEVHEDSKTIPNSTADNITNHKKPKLNAWS